MFLSGQNLSLLQKSIELDYSDTESNTEADLANQDQVIEPKKVFNSAENDSSVFVQTNKEHRLSKIPNLKIGIGKSLSNLVIVGKLVNDIKASFINIDKTLNIESETEEKLPIERKNFIDENATLIKTIINETEIEGKKIFLSNLKLDVQMDLDKSEKYKAKIDLSNTFSNFNLDFEGVEDNLDKRFNQIKETNKSLSTIDILNEEVELHTKVLKRQMDKFISAGKEATLFHLNSNLDDSSLVVKMKLKASIFLDTENLALTQLNAHSGSVLNLLP